MQPCRPTEVTELYHALPLAMGTSLSCSARMALMCSVAYALYRQVAVSMFRHVISRNTCVMEIIMLKQYITLNQARVRLFTQKLIGKTDSMQAG